MDYSKISNVTHKWVDILMPFTSNYYARYTATDLSKLTQLPQQTISRVLNELLDLNLLNYTIEGKNKYYFLESKRFLVLEILENYKSLDFSLSKREVFLILSEILEVCDSIIVFGSYASNKYDKSSDLDLIVINGNVEKLKQIKKKYSLEINYENISYNDLKSSFKKKLPLSIEIKQNHIFYKDVSKLVKIFLENGYR